MERAAWRPPSLAWCSGLDRQGVDSFAHEVAERGIDHALPLNPRLAGECGTFDRQREMAFAGGIVAAMPAMSLAVVDELNARRRKRRVEPVTHFSRHRTGVRNVHCPYIGRFDGNASVQIARAGRGGEGALRGPGM